MPFQLPRVTVSPRTAKLLWLLAFTAAACVLLHGIHRLPRVNLSETLTILPQGMYLMRALRHQDIALSMPMSPFLATLFAGLPQWIELVIWPLFLILACMLAMAAGRRLASAPGGMAALLLAAFAFGSSKFWTPGSMSYCLACGIVTLALAMRAGKPRTWGSELLTALAIGFSYTLKSPLFLLPPLLAAYDIFTGKLREGKTSAGKLALLALGPYALLLPWTYMNWKVFHVFRLFEGGRADENIITGALGIVYTVEGAYSLADTAGQNIVWWAVKTVLSHPLVYIEGVLKRLYGLFVWYPAVSTLFLLGIVRLRKLPQARTLGLFVGYIAGIMCLMSIQKAYFAPIWIPALAIAAAGLMPAKSPSDESTLAQRATLLVFIAIGTALYLPLSAYLIAYPNRLQPPAAAFSTDAPAPDDNPVLLVRMSETALASGNTAQAYIYAAAALRRTNSPLTASAFLTALSARGVDIAPPLRNKTTALQDLHSTLRRHRLLFLNSLLQNRMAEAEALLPQLREEWEKHSLSFSGITSQREAALYSKQQRESTLFNNVYIPGLLEKYPRELRSELAVKVLKLGIDSPRLQVMRLEHDLNTGGEEATPEQIEQMLKAAKTEESLARLLDLCQRHGLHRESVRYAETFLEKQDSPPISLYLAGARLAMNDLSGAQLIMDRLRDVSLNKANRDWLSDLMLARDIKAIDLARAMKTSRKSHTEDKLTAALLEASISSIAALRLADSFLFIGQYKTAASFLGKVKINALPEHEVGNYYELQDALPNAELLALYTAGDFTQLERRSREIISASADGGAGVALYLATAQAALRHNAEAAASLERIKKFRLTQAQKRWLAFLENMLYSGNKQPLTAIPRDDIDCRDLNSMEQKALELIRENKDIGRVYLAQVRLEEGKETDAQNYLEQTLKKKLILRKKEIGRGSPAGTQEANDRDTALLISESLKQMAKTSSDPKALLRIARAFTEAYPYNPPGNLYLAAALIGTGKYDEAGKKLFEISGMQLNDSEKQWLSSLRGYLDRESKKCSLSSPGACLKKLLRKTNENK